MGKVAVVIPVKTTCAPVGKGYEDSILQSKPITMKAICWITSQRLKDSLDCGAFLLLTLMQFDFPDTVGNLGSLCAGAVCLLRFPVAVALYKLWVVKVSKFGFANLKTDGHIVDTPQWRKSLESFSWILKGMHVHFFGETIDEETTSYLCKCYILHSTRSRSCGNWWNRLKHSKH